MPRHGNFLRLLGFVVRLLLSPHPELQLEQVGLGAAGRFGVVAVAIVEGLAAIVQSVNHVLTLFLLECVFL